MAIEASRSFARPPRSTPPRIRFLFVGPRLRSPLPSHGRFLLSGWAIDRGSPSGPGIDANHVWATRLGDASASFVRAASYGAVRPDVGAFFGAPYTASGYSPSVSTLAPGTYDIVVYARSTVTGTFNQAKVVRLTIN